MVNTKPMPSENVNICWHNTERFEIMLSTCVSLGKRIDLDEYINRATFSGAVIGRMSMSDLRNHKNMLISTAALIARLAIKLGMNYESSLCLSDGYICAVENMRTCEDVMSLWKDMVYDYTDRIAELSRFRTESRLVRGIVDYVRRNVYERMSVSSIATYVGFSQDYISSKFKKETGENLSGYIAEMKTSEAKWLLVSTSKPLVEISEMLKFSSQSYFQTVFKKATGLTPTEFRSMKGVI
ncbi:MAG: AraC family transcriptional regulator [Clostridiales bacterium]|jgi:AraC-like DNA-binding protein|nr:AraC family transcriptional regulator [Clostridiales bacterium]